MRDERLLIRTGAVGAGVGAIVSVGAGMSFGNITNEHTTQQVLVLIADRPVGYWPTVHLAFIIGALLWVAGFIGLEASLDRGTRSSALGRLAVAALVLGAAVHVIDSSISGFGLQALAEAWATAPPADRAALVPVGDALLYVLNGTWRSVHSYFHGLPFVLAGLAVVFSQRYPAWLGWIGVLGGAASLLGGVLQFLGVIPGTERLVIVPAQIVSVWSVAVGILLWRIPSQLQGRSDDHLVPRGGID